MCALGTLAPAAHSAATLEEIPVTATRYTTELQNTALSVSALTGERLRQSGTADIVEWFARAPGLNYTTTVGVATAPRFMESRAATWSITSWTSPDSTLRCGIVTVNVPPIQRMELETWLWRMRRIRIRGGEPSKVRLCTAYYVQRDEIDQFLNRFDQYSKMHHAD